MPSGFKKRDLHLALLLFAISLLVGALYHSTHWRIHKTANFYQDEMLPPAVMFACTGHLAVPPPNDELNRFLRTEIDEFPCSKLGDPALSESMDTFSLGHFYMVLSIGLVWKAFGVSWAVLSPFFGLFYAITVVSAFFVFRAFLSGGLSFLLGLMFLSSPNHLMQLTGLRDYSKGVFVLVILLLSIFVVIPQRFGKWSKKPLLPALVGGMILGIGYRFRPDTFMAIPLVVVAVLFFSAKALLSSWKSKALFGITFFAGFACIAGLPLLKPTPYPVTHNGGCTPSMNLLQGQMSNQTEDLRLSIPSYEMGQSATDAVIGIHEASYQVRLLPQSARPVLDNSYIYRNLFLNALWQRPADFLIRWFASIKTLTQLPFVRTAGVALAGYYNMNTVLRVHWIDWRYSCTQILGKLAPFIAALAAFILMISNLRLGIFFAFMLFYYLGYPSIRFQDRHFFHLEPIGLLALGITLEWIKKLIQNGKFDLSQLLRKLLRPLIASLAIAALLITSLMLARIYQTHQLQNYARTVVSQPRTPLHLPVISPSSAPFEPELAGNDIWNHTFDDQSDSTSKDPFVVAYVGIELRNNSLEARKVKFEIIYDSRGSHDPSTGRKQTIALQPDGKAVTYFFPAYRGYYGRFLGVKFKEEDREYVRTIFKLTRTPPLMTLLSFTHSDDPAQNRYFQQFDFKPCEPQDCKNYL